MVCIYIFHCVTVQAENKLSFDVILKALEVLDNMQDSEARGFINSVLKFEFIIALIDTNYPQGGDLNLLQVHTQAKVVI